MRTLISCLHGHRCNTNATLYNIKMMLASKAQVRAANNASVQVSPTLISASSTDSPYGALAQVSSATGVRRCRSTSSVRLGRLRAVETETTTADTPTTFSEAPATPAVKVVSPAGRGLYEHGGL